MNEPGSVMLVVDAVDGLKQPHSGGLLDPQTPHRRKPRSYSGWPRRVSSFGIPDICSWAPRNVTTAIPSAPSSRLARTADVDQSKDAFIGDNRRWHADTGCAMS